MPQVFKIGADWGYFWSDENEPLEPVQIHIAEGKPVKNATKVWITRSGNCLVANNTSHIPERTLKNIVRIIE